MPGPFEERIVFQARREAIKTGSALSWKKADAGWGRLHNQLLDGLLKEPR